MKKNTEKIKVVFCAGGTGGHIYPAIAVADRLKQGNRLSDIVFFVSGRDVERSVFSGKSFVLKEISSAGSGELFSFRAIPSVFNLLRGFVFSLTELIKDRPDIIVSMGGYSSIPPVLAGYLLRIPVILHEQNALPGKANRFLSKFAKKVAISFERSADGFPRSKARLTGNPVREEILSAETRQRPGGKFSLLVMGGSQGSAALNSAVVEMLSLIDWQKTNIGRIVHITGQKAPPKNTETEYVAIPYEDRIWELLASSDLVISRAGATAIAEITARALPSVLIPYPHAAEKHQDVNAKVLEDAGAAKVLGQDKLSGRALLDIINSLLKSGEDLRRMSLMSGKLAKPDAAREMAGLIYETI